MKVLTLWQPWATLYAHGVKLIETRPKPTTFHGTYLIHAAKQWTKEQREICKQEPFKSALGKLGYYYFPNPSNRNSMLLPLGAIIGAVDINECCEINIPPTRAEPYYFRIEKQNVGIWTKIEEPELSFGDYRVGRYAWIGKNHRVLKEPIPYKNGQGYYLDFKGDENKLIFK